MWLKAMDAYDANDVQAAVERHMADPDAGMYFPLPANLIGHIQHIRRERAERQSSDALLGEMRDLRRRKEAGEEFFTFADVLREYNARRESKNAEVKQ